MKIKQYYYKNIFYFIQISKCGIKEDGSKEIGEAFKNMNNINDLTLNLWYIFIIKLIYI